MDITYIKINYLKLYSDKSLLENFDIINYDMLTLNLL